MMKIDKVIWNYTNMDEYCIAVVGKPLIQLRKDLPKVTSIVWEEYESIFITFNDGTQLQIMHPEEVYYVPK